MDNQNRLLLFATLAVVIVGGVVLWVRRDIKSKKPVIGWYSLGTETFDLKPGAFRGFSYRDVPPKFRIEVQASAPVTFGFVTPDVYGHYTSTPMQLDFASLPCGSGPTTGVDLNCNTEASKRYLLLTDSREDIVPEPAAPNRKSQNAAPQPAMQPDNHVTVKMYDWRCLAHCENLPHS